MNRFALSVCFLFYLTNAENVGNSYESILCLSNASVVAREIFQSPTQCAIFCDINNHKAFSYNNRSGECKVIMENASGNSCEIEGGIEFFKLNECPLPDLKGYTLQRTYAGGRAMRKYRCVEFTDPEVVDNCPVVKCNQRITDKPASCSVKDIFSSSTRHYEGGVTCTVKGVTCQRWDTDFPHGHNQLSGRSDLGNRCQIDGDTRPWCYTTDPEIRWDYCPVEELPSCPPPPDIEHDTIKINTIWRYADTALYKCSSNTTEEPVSSCPVSTCVHSTQTWTTANVSCSGTDCYNATSHTYHGRVSCTENGIPCQRWDSNMPHVPGHFHGRSDLENWCQMTEELNKPWCYTTDPSTLYSFCPVDPCT